MSITEFGFHLVFHSKVGVDYSYAGAALGFVAAVISSFRWLRVAQREHYIPGYTSKFAFRWYSDTQRPINPVLGVLALLAGVVAVAKPSQSLPSWLGFLVVMFAILLTPRGLRYRGRTSPLKYTRRLTVLALLTWLLSALLLFGGAWFGLGIVVGAVVLICVPLVVDLALFITMPFERRGLSKYVRIASKKLERISPRVVGITGSYGKTSTKTYLAHLISTTFATLSSPASFNNRAGLTRTVNEHLAPGTEVLVAEMGTYGKGEIAELCTWLRPEISAITSIGPVHLERFGTEDAILEAKSEITKTSSTVVLNNDDYRLADFSRTMEGEGKTVRRVSGNDIAADVAVKDDDEGNIVVYASQKRIGSMTDIDISRSNLAIAVSIALELGVPESVIESLLPTLPVAKNRLNVSTAPSGVTLLDDTYNSNPAGARLALRALERRKTSNNRVVVVTPGMIELGKKQYEENSFFARAAAKVATDIVIVGFTNRKAMLAGLQAAVEEGSSPTLFLMKNREHAVAWVRRNLGPGDVVLYENDLPDHFL